MSKAKFTPAFKVVQVADDRMFSANSNADDLPEKVKKARSCIVEYNLGRRALPQKHLKEIFVCNSFADAQAAHEYYSRNASPSKSCRILRGKAANLREFSPTLKKYRPHCIQPPSSFKSFVCDWFTPTHILL